jgi:ribosomal protein RSM22 (predicted rRNA methylase)
MQLPAWLRDAIEELAAEVPQRDLARAAAELSDAYRAGAYSRTPLDNAARRIAYLAQRMPATYAACARIFAEIHSLAPEFAPEHILDLGAGPATATLAATSAWTTVETCTLIERDVELVSLGKRLLAASPSATAKESWWFELDLANLATSKKTELAYELVVISYALGEFTSVRQQELMSMVWTMTRDLLVLIEPGTPRGFANVLAARKALGALGAHILAPCPRCEPHPCPMAEIDDWCHFAQRVERTSLHRALKGGELGYEDEKFSYVVLSRQPITTATARVVRHPIIRKGHVELQLCTPVGLARLTVGKSQKERYRAARKAKWGDAFQI